MSRSSLMGYHAASTPLGKRRALTFLDPPYEERQEDFGQLTAARRSQCRQCFLERVRLGALQLDQYRPILRAQLGRTDERRAGIEMTTGRPGTKLADQIGVLAQLRRTMLGLHEALDTRRRLLRPREIVAAPTRVGVEVQKSLILPLQCAQQREQRDVLVNVGEIPGVEAVAVLHG